jgi:hypothetical protein
VSVLASSVMLVGALGACGVSKVVRPDAPTVAAATGRTGACTEDSPLVVDWRGEERGDLEIAMRRGLVVVQHDCEGTRLVRDCSIEGAYGFEGTTPKTEVVQVVDGDDLKARLPQMAAAAGATLEGEFARGSSLDVAMVMVGKALADLPTARPDQLKGRCDDATHFVRSATIGAFAVNTGSAANLRAAVEVFGAEAGGGSSSSKTVARRDGDLTACDAATADAVEAPRGCTAVIRLQLARLDDPLPPAVDVGGSAVGAGERSCPADDPEACTRLCDAGDTDACFVLGTILQRGVDAPEDLPRANQLYRGACDEGHQDACVLLGISYLTGPEYEVGLGLLERACELNNPTACSTLAHVWRDGKQPDPDRAKTYAAKACALGHSDSCG